MWNGIEARPVLCDTEPDANKYMQALLNLNDSLVQVCVVQHRRVEIDFPIEACSHKWNWTELLK